MKRPSPLLQALFPWIGAVFLWFGVLQPMQANQGDRLDEQTQVRRERLRAERAAREVDSLRTRVSSVLKSACRSDSNPAALRQRAIAATTDLGLSPMTLTVAGSPTPGSVVDATGSRRSSLELLKRLGDPSTGGFLRSASLRIKEGRWGVSASAGVLESFSPMTSGGQAKCAAPAEPGPTEPPRPIVTQEVRRPVTRPRITPPLEPTPIIVPPNDPLPFTLVGFLSSDGRKRVSVRVGDQVKVVGIGDEVDGWRCLSIDPDEGAVFVSAAGRRVVIKDVSSSR